MFGLAGHEPRLYNSQALLEDSDTLAICEGEPDTWTVAQLGIPAVGYQGVDGWEEYFYRAISNYERIIVPAHGEDVGRSMAKQLAREVDGGVVIRLPDGEDVNSIAQARGLDYVKELLGL